MKYIFNHYYVLRNDVKRAIICSSDYTSSSIDIDKGWVAFIHPIYAMIFSFFSEPISLDDAVDKVSNFFGFTKEYAKVLLQNFIENKEPFHTVYKGDANNFPRNILVDSEKMKDGIRKYAPEDFVYTGIDLNTRRLFRAPLYLTFMINNKCLTNCIYCYADRYTHNQLLEFAKVRQIIEDAYKLGIVSFNLDGGEFFLYPYWREILDTLKMYNYRPEVISTKYPISTEMISDFARYNINLQVSFDSISQPTLDAMVGRIPNYCNRMMETLRCIDKVMSFQIATILTKYNGNTAELEHMYQFLSNLKNLRRWEVRVAFKSLYSRSRFEDREIERASIDKIHEWVKTKQAVSKFEIIWSPGKEIDFFTSHKGGVDFKGAKCSANSIHMFVLPDGEVTICEQLYWNKHFLIGDLKKDSIEEVWNSANALYLANRKREDYSKQSACRECKIFEICKKEMNECFPNIMKVYGSDHWDFPDPRCDKAPRNISEKIYV